MEIFRGHDVPWPARRATASWALLALLTAVGLFFWSRQMDDVARSPVPGTIEVVSATWGGNCGALKDNVLQYVWSACSGQQECDYIFDWGELGNPAPQCAKQFHVDWRCGPNLPLMTLASASEPRQDAVFQMACGSQEGH